MLVLGIETSCDETAAAVVQDGRAVLSNIVFSQVALHQAYGGVVPEIAARHHVEHLPAVVQQAVEVAGVCWSALDAVAVTYGPGLASALLVGLAAAKGLSLRLQRPLVGINHLEAHLYSVCLGATAPRPEDIGPYVALMVSGGHTCLVRVERPLTYRLLGRTVDDAAGEAFDKGAGLLGLGYPGGPAIEAAGREGDPRRVHFPRGVLRRKHARLGGLDPRYCFSFSGVKTALRYHLRAHPLPANDERQRAHLAASYQEAIVDTLVSRVLEAAEGTGCVSLVGGVALNRRLRAKLELVDPGSRAALPCATPVG